VEIRMVIHLMTTTHKETVPRMAVDDDAHVAKDSAMAEAATETRTQDHTMVEDLGEMVEIMVVTAVAVVEVILVEQVCDKSTRVRPSPSPPSIT
jgi:hypothetical protein